MSADPFVVVPPREIDFGTAAALAADVRQAFAGGAAAVWVDFGQVTFCDSSGIQVLIAGLKYARALDREFVVLNAPPRVLRLAQLVGVAELLGLPSA